MRLVVDDMLCSTYTTTFVRGVDADVICVVVDDWLTKSVPITVATYAEFHAVVEGFMSPAESYEWYTLHCSDTFTTENLKRRRRVFARIWRATPDALYMFARRRNLINSRLIVSDEYRPIGARNRRCYLDHETFVSRKVMR